MGLATYLCVTMHSRAYQCLYGLEMVFRRSEVLVGGVGSGGVPVGSIVRVGTGGIVADWPCERRDRGKGYA